MLCFWLLLLVKYNHIINTWNKLLWWWSLSLLSLVGRTRSWGRFLFITRQRGRVCCCSSVITCMISIYKGCVLVNETVTTFFFALLQVKPSYFTENLSVFMYHFKEQKSCCFKNVWTFWTTLCLAIYICMSGKFPIFLSPPVQFMSIVLQHSMEQFVSLLLSHDLDKKQLPSHLKTNKCVKFYSFYFEMHHDWVLQVIQWSFSWSTFLVD